MAKQLAADIQAFAIKALNVLQKEASDADDDRLIRQMQANVLRTQDIASQDVSKQVGDLASMIKFNSAGRKVVNLGEVPAVTDKNVAKILDLNAAIIFMPAHKIVAEYCIACDEDCKASLEWARAQLEDPSTLPEETLTNISEGASPLWRFSKSCGVIGLALWQISRTQCSSA